MRNKQKIIIWLSNHSENPLYRLILQRYELLSYTIFGVLTTLVNIVIYTTLEFFLGQENWYLSNFPAIILAILFAYITNRSFVFDSAGSFWKEMYKFFAARIMVSLAFEYGIIYLLFNVLHFELQLNLIVTEISYFKIISLLMVFIGNYLASKFFVFKSKLAQPQDID